MHGSRFARFAWMLLLYSALVVLWGAYVRATGSGAGCGSHWPLCDGEVMPVPRDAAMRIEFTHRLSAALSIIGAVVLFIWAWRAYPRKHHVRLGASLTLAFTFSEALVGAGLVLFRLVAEDASVYRAVAISAHLVNTFALIASIALTAWWAGGASRLRLAGQGAVLWAVGLGLMGALLLGVGGAITALGDTLFPASSLAEGLRSDFTPGASFLLRLRPLHPLLAVSVGVYVALSVLLVARLRPSPAAQGLARWVILLYVAQLLVGLVNLVMLAPVPMQLLHLLVADVLWVWLVLFSAAALAADAPRAQLAADAVQGQAGAAARATWKHYLALTKPRVISLLLFTTLTAMVAAQGGWPGFWLFTAVAVGGYMAAGAANALNMVVDRDIDGRMRRTAKRPVVTNTVSTRNALLFGFGLAVGSFVILTAAANLLTALLAQAGLAFYVVVYTLVLKRRTWHNIVIGGAAGAFPPLVGWAAVAGDLSPLAWTLFALVCVWTPVHFWALALLIKDDYAEAGVPMLPVVRGEHATVVQIAFYAVLTAVLSALPVALGQAGLGYLGVAALLNVSLLVRAVHLVQQPERPRALAVYKYSMVYLALLFLAIAVDRAMHLPVL